MCVLKNFFQVCQIWPLLVILLFKLVYLPLYILVLWPFSFQKLKREMKNLFSNFHNLSFWNSPIFALFRITLRKSVRIISDVIKTEVTILKFYLCHFICNMTEYCAKFQVQSSTLPEFGNGDHNVPTPSGQQKTKKARAS